jgi:hypothetical protein
MCLQVEAAGAIAIAMPSEHNCGNSCSGMSLQVAAAGAAAIAMPSETTVATPVQVCVYRWEQQEQQLLPRLLTRLWQLLFSYVFTGGSSRGSR